MYVWYMYRPLNPLLAAIFNPYFLLTPRSVDVFFKDDNEKKVTGGRNGPGGPKGTWKSSVGEIHRGDDHDDYIHILLKFSS